MPNHSSDSNPVSQPDLKPLDPSRISELLKPSNQTAQEILASDAERDAVLALLQRSQIEGRIDLDQYSARATACLQAVTVGDLQQQLKGLPVAPEKPASPTVQPKQAKAKRSWQWPDPQELVELIMPLMIVAVVIAACLPFFLATTDRAKESVATTNLTLAMKTSKTLVQQQGGYKQLLSSNKGIEFSEPTLQLAPMAQMPLKSVDETGPAKLYVDDSAAKRNQLSICAIAENDKVLCGLVSGRAAKLEFASFSAGQLSKPPSPSQLQHQIDQAKSQTP